MTDAGALRIVVAPDSFGGALDSVAVAAAIAAATATESSAPPNESGATTTRSVIGL